MIAPGGHHSTGVEKVVDWRWSVTCRQQLAIGAETEPADIIASAIVGFAAGWRNVGEERQPHALHVRHVGGAILIEIAFAECKGLATPCPQSQAEHREQTLGRSHRCGVPFVRSRQYQSNYRCCQQGNPRDADRRRAPLCLTL